MYNSIEPNGPSKVTFFTSHRLADRVLVCALLCTVLILPILHETNVHLHRWERVDGALRVYPKGGFHAFVPMAQPPHGCLQAFTTPEQGLHGDMALVAAVTDLYRDGGAIDLYAMGAFKNMARLRNSTSSAGIHTILLVSAASACDNSNASRAALGMAFASGWGSVCCVDPAVMGVQSAQLVPERFRHTFDRLIVWGFTNYSLVLYIVRCPSRLQAPAWAPNLPSARTCLGPKPSIGTHPPGPQTPSHSR